MIFVRFHKKIRLNWEFFLKIFGRFSSPGGQNLKCAQKIPHFGKKINLESIVAPRDKSSRAFHQNIKTKKRTRGFLSSVNWSGENFFFPNFFFVSDQQKTQNPSPQSLILLSIFSQIIILRKSSQAF